MTSLITKQKILISSLFPHLAHGKTGEERAINPLGLVHIDYPAEVVTQSKRI